MRHSPPFFEPAGRSALRIAVVYLSAAALWIVASDLVVYRFLPGLQAQPWIHLAKGVFFVGATGALLYWWTRRLLAQRDEAADRHREVLEESPDLIYRYRLAPERGFEYVSPASTELVGFSPEEHYADPELALRRVHPDDRARLERLLASPESVEDPVELRWIAKSGEVVWTEHRHRLIREDGGGRVMEGVARDISARRAAEEERALLVAAMDQAGEAILLTDAEGTIRYANTAYRRLTGYELHELVGENPRIVKSGEHSASFYREMWETLNDGRTFRGRFRDRRKDGTLYTQDSTITPVLSESGKPTAFVGVTRDVTVEEALQTQIEHAQRMELVGQMAAGAAHDFKNLLGVIQMNGEMARGALKSEEMDEVLRNVDEVVRSARRGEQLVRRLLSLGGRHRLERSERSLSELIEALTPTLRSVLPATVELEVVTEADVPRVLIDDGATEQIILNLMTNARDAVAEGGRVELRVEAVLDGEEMIAAEDGTLRGAVRVTVSDTGAGMDAETLEHIFEPFFTTKSEIGGTGLGLPMVQALVRQQEGRIRFRSTSGEGTVVELLFPVAPAEAGREPAPPQSPPDAPVGAAAPTPDDAGTPVEAVRDAPAGSPAQRGARLLLVDDDPALRKVVARSLERLGFEVMVCAEGSEALDVLQSSDHTPELVITDVVMPKLSGADLYRRALELGLDLPFVFMSGSAPSESPAGALLGGSVLFLEKPFTVQELGKAVERALAYEAERSQPAAGR